MNRVRECREAAAMSQAALARTLQICQQAVAKWETGRGDPRWDLAPRLAHVLNCKIDELFVVGQ